MGFKVEDVKKAGGKVWVWRYEFVLATIEEVEALKKQKKVNNQP